MYGLVSSEDNVSRSQPLWSDNNTRPVVTHYTKANTSNGLWSNSNDTNKTPDAEYNYPDYSNGPLVKKQNKTRRVKNNKPMFKHLSTPMSSDFSALVPDDHLVIKNKPKAKPRKVFKPIVEESESSSDTLSESIYKDSDKNYESGDSSCEESVENSAFGDSIFKDDDNKIPPGEVESLCKDGYANDKKAQTVIRNNIARKHGNKISYDSSSDNSSACSLSSSVGAKHKSTNMSGYSNEGLWSENISKKKKSTNVDMSGYPNDGLWSESVTNNGAMPYPNNGLWSESSCSNGNKPNNANHLFVQGSTNTMANITINSNSTIEAVYINSIQGPVTIQLGLNNNYNFRPNHMILFKDMTPEFSNSNTSFDIIIRVPSSGVKIEYYDGQGNIVAGTNAGYLLNSAGGNVKFIYIPSLMPGGLPTWGIVSQLYGNDR